MLKSYSKLTIRVLNKNSTFSIINIGGLSLGLAGFLLLFQFVSFELSYDSFQPGSDGIYRVSYSKEKVVKSLS